MAGNVLEYASPSLAGRMGDHIITPLSSDAVGLDKQALSVAVWGSGVTTANAARAYPLCTVDRVLVTKFFWVNGGTVNGDTDIGVYTEDGGVKLGSTGPVANSGTNTFQLADPLASFYLPANSRLWIVQSTASGTQTYFGFDVSIAGANFLGMKEQLSAWSTGLPASLTLGDSTSSIIRFVGLTAQSLI